MRALATECVEWLKEHELYDVFIQIAKGSSKKSKSIQVYSLSIDEAVALTKDIDVSSCREKIVSKIHTLINIGFLYMKILISKILRTLIIIIIGLWITIILAT